MFDMTAPAFPGTWPSRTSRRTTWTTLVDVVDETRSLADEAWDHVDQAWNLVDQG
jgi:hypothetical protein